MSILTDRDVDPSLRNYLAFLQCFRGTVIERPGVIVIDSDRRDFRMLMPIELAERPALGGFDGSVLSLPWVHGLEDALAEADLRKQTDVVFMSKTIEPRPHAREVEIRIAESTRDIEDFSLVQCRSFTDSEEEFDQWFAWLRAANLRNLENERCRFLIAALDGKPASVTLLVQDGRTCGIYAVATLPEHRRTGLSTSMLRASERRAAADGFVDVCLQVYAHSYAFGFYRRRGFDEQYRVGVWQ